MKALIIGACNLDIFANTFQPLQKRESLPGKISLGFGGVGRNICENLAHLGVDCSFVSLLGTDVMSQSLETYMKSLSVNTQYIRKVEGADMSMYFALLDQDLDMLYGINDMSLSTQLKKVDIDAVDEIAETLDLLVLDTNLEQEMIDYTFEKFTYLPIAVDCISAVKGMKLKKHLDKISVLKCNVFEAAALTDMTLKTQSEKVAACLYLANQGIKQVLITDGEQNVYYNTPNGVEIFKVTPLETIVNATGAGDAFLSGYLYGYLSNMSTVDAIEVGCKAASITLMSEKACTLNIKKGIKEKE